MLKSLSVLLVAAALSGCAAMNRLDNDVSSYGSWPTGRQPASFAFERLPSQQQKLSTQQQALEDAARPALESVGFKQVGDVASADYTVQLGAAVSADAHDGFWPYGFGARGLHRYGRYGYYGYGYSRYGSGFYPSPTFDREVVVLIRDRRTGLTVYETRATNSGNLSSINGLLPAMFEAALKDFPNTGTNPRRVVTKIGG